jgi:tetratricopeptide (TPR) repeat protein
VGFWAFAEMMRSRLGLLEDDGHTQVSAKVQEGVRAVARDDAEADWLAPRLLELLGAGGTGRRFERPDLFSAWSTYLERLGSGEPVVLLFEDMQHADAGLLDFVDYLLESGVARLFIMVCARPELRERRPSLVAGSRSSVVVASRLDDVAMAELIDGLVADLPARARSAIVARSEGVPLYAVETVRSLIDRDAVVPRDGRYVFDDPDGSKVDLAQLSAPTSLQTLIAARLDALTATERRVVQDASVLGLAFRQAGVEKLCGLPPAEIDIAMLGLVRKGVIETQLDPRSPELGQYRFLQALVREVAYSTLARKDRKVRHLAAADHLASEGEAAETFSGVIAQHLLDALEASATTDPDRPTIAERARDLLVVAADRAESLGAPDEALHCSLAAMELEPDEAEMLPLRERAARVAVAAGEYLRGVDLATDAADAYRRSGDEVGAARSTMYLAWSLLNLGRNEEALVAIEPAFEKIRNHGDADETICDLAHALTVVLRAIRPPEAAYPVLMTQVRLAERLGDPARQVQALNGVAIHLALFGSVAGYLALLERAAEMAEEHHLPIALARSLSNLLSEIYRRDLPRAREVATDAMAASRRAGSVQYMENALVNASFTWWMAGEWDLLRDNAADWFATHVANPLSSLLIMPFTLACAERQVELPVIALTHSDFPAEQSFADVTLALRQEAAGDLDGAAKAASAALRRGFTDIDVLEDFEVLWTPTVELQLRAGHVEEAEALLTFGPAAESAIRCEVGAAMAPRLAGLVAIAKGEDPEQLLRAAELEFTAYGAPYYLARTRLELGRWLCDQGRAAEGMPLLDLARTGLVELGALRSLTELEAAASASGLAVSA